MDKSLKRKAIDEIMFMEYDDYEPWCKVLHLDDFDETHFTGSLADENRRKHFQDDIDTVHHYINDPVNPHYRKAFMDYFLYQISVDYTPESMSVDALEKQEWKIADTPERDECFDHIIRRSLEELSDSLFRRKDEIPDQSNDREKFISLKNKFLDVFEHDALFLINTEPDDEMPAVIGMDKETIGIYFLSN